MNIYFGASISGGREHAAIYPFIVTELKKYGTVLCEHFADPTLSAQTGTGNDLKAIHDRDLAWVQEADVVVAELTTPSLGVGYEVGKAEEWGKRIFGLFDQSTGRRLSPMISEIETIELLRYETEADIAEFLQEKFTSS